MTMMDAPPQTRPGSPDAAATAAFAHIFQALAEPTRLTVLQHLATGEHRVRDLVQHLSLAQSTVSKHLAVLTECALVTVRVEGRASWYSLAQPEALAHIIVAAEQLLTATGHKKSLHSHITAAASDTEG